MHFYSQKVIFVCAFVLCASFPGLCALRLNKYLYISLSTLPRHDFRLKLQTSPMPRPSRESKSEGSRSTKVDHERLKQTLRHFQEESEKKVSASTKEDREAEVNSWKVILYNDDIHSFTYVTESISKCVPQLPLAKAHLITLEAHKNGQAEILRTWKEKGEQYCRELQKYGLTVCIINDLRKG